MAKEPALFLGSVMVGADARATPVGSDHGVTQCPLGVSVEMPAEDRPEVEFQKADQHIVRIERAHRHAGTQGKMSKENCRPAPIKSWQLFIEPRKRIGGNVGLLPCGAFGRVDAYQLPTSIFEGVIN
jgi:hypothetical protein